MTLSKIASYFNVSVDYLIGNKKKKKNPAPKGDGTSEIESILGQLTPSRQAKLLELARLYLYDQRKSGESE